jgi:hypothetical protein
LSLLLVLLPMFIVAMAGSSRWATADQVAMRRMWPSSFCTPSLPDALH